MKTDRFVKVMLVIIAGLLFLNCVKDVSFNNSNSLTLRNDSMQSPNPKKTSTIPFIETSVDAAPVPSFIQKGKTYKCWSGGGASATSYDLTVANIDKESGWIQTTTGNWFNISALISCSESSAK